MTEEELEEIKHEHLQRKDELIEIAISNLRQLNKAKGVHASNYRIKNEDKLIKKIIRKNKEGKNITMANYRQKITDLIGIRILHIFKDDWIDIDNFIRDSYQLVEKPTAYIRKGDIIKEFNKKLFLVKEHEFGYRSIHYVIKSKVNKKDYIIEIQVRTIFEEAWGEMDHFVRYPDITDNALISQYSLILNRLAGLGDEMGLNMRSLKNTIDINNAEIERRDAVITEISEERDKMIAGLLEKVNISEGEKEKYRKKLTEVENQIKMEQEKIIKIKNKTGRSYFLATDVINELKNNKCLKIEDHNFELLYNPRNLRPEIDGHIYIYANNKSLISLYFRYINGDYYINPDDSSLRRLIMLNYIKLENLRYVYL
jgi:ppGpp synthetase/RelA/SpoT-type nucleotidyltranferase